MGSSRHRIARSGIFWWLRGTDGRHIRAVAARNLRMFRGRRLTNISGGTLKKLHGIRVGLVNCASPKLTRPAPARDLYVS